MADSLSRAKMRVFFDANGDLTGFIIVSGGYDDFTEGSPKRRTDYI